jgi:phospholipid/cholesterol/gamma-HCH transport system substrate-binding protein
MMESKTEQTLVGLFVLICAVVLIGTIFAISGTFGRDTKTYHAYFPFAGWIEPGMSVRYSGGPKVGRVETVRIDPQNVSRLEITFTVQSDLPVKTDSLVKIMSTTPLGDNHLEIFPGTPQAANAPNGALLPSQTYIDLNSLLAQLNDLAPRAQQLLVTLSDRVGELKETVARVNDLLSVSNRANLAATLANTRGLLEENRPQIRATLQNLNGGSQKLEPLLEDLRRTSAQTNKTLDNVDALIGENRPDVRQAIAALRRSLTTVTDVTGRLDQTLDVNSENIDELLDNLRQATENLNEFTATIKNRPASLIRSTSPPEHKPGDNR